MAISPAYTAARSGLLGDPGAVDASAQINQFLGTRGITVLYQGTQILTQNGAGLGGITPTSFWSCHLDGTDYDQPFTMSGTAIGRVTVPVLPVGSGADLIVSLCPDSSGSPGTPITTARIPAAWITQMAAVAGSSGPSSSLQLATPASAPLALPQFNTLMASGGSGTTWTPPAPTSAGAIVDPVTISAGNYLVLVGGTASGNPVGNVYTVQWAGGGVLASAVAQPSLPQVVGNTTLMANATTLIAAGGTTTGSVLISSVYTAGWNPNTGQISAWTQQTSLPQILGDTTGAATANAVYVIGGDTGSSVLNTVYWAPLSNGQISSWNTGPPLPTAVKAPFVSVIGNYLVVAGGYTNPGFTASTNSVYYATINADGSLGAWRTGPPMPTGAGGTASGNTVITASGFVVVGGYTGSAYSTEIQSLSFGPSGPGTWALASGAASGETGGFPLGPGQWQFFSLFTTNYDDATLYQVPLISVPLPATGLTNGATYHVLIQQASGDLNDYLRMPLQHQAFPGNPTVLSRASIGGSGWTAGTSGNAIPIGIYDQTASGQPLHFWEDGGARISTLVYNTTPDSTPLGIAEAVMQPAPVLNANPAFTAGTAPWSVTGGTLTQSATHTRANLPFSGLLTPSGSASSSYIESEKVPVLQGHNYVAAAWLYSGPGYGSCAVNINWYNASSTLLSTTSGTVTSLSAGTWTQLSIASTTAAPPGAFYGTVVAVETGTPPSSALLWVSSATLQDTQNPMLASVSQINYAGAGLYQPPVGTTQLA